MKKAEGRDRLIQILTGLGGEGYHLLEEMGETGLASRSLALAREIDQAIMRREVEIEDATEPPSLLIPSDGPEARVRAR